MAGELRIRADEAHRVPLFVAAGAVLGMCLTPTIAIGAEGNVQVTVTRRSVRIVGDADPNDLQLTFDSESAELSITGLDSTTVNDGESTIVGVGRRDIVLEMGDGADQVTLDGGAPRNFRATMGDGNDRVFIDNGKFPGGIRIDHGSGFATTFVQNSSVRGRTLILGGDENDSLSLRNCDLGGPLTLNARGGNDQIGVDNCTTRRSVKLIGGDGNDSFFPARSNYLGPTSIVGGDGNDQIWFDEINTTTFARPLRIVGGPGNDLLRPGKAVLAGCTMLVGDGDDTVNMIGFNSTRPVRIAAGAGNDNVDLSDCFFDSSFSMLGGPGDEFFSFRSGRVGTSSRVVGGAGNDQCYNNVPVGRGLTMIGGAGDDTLGIGVGGTGRTLLSAGPGDDSFDGASGTTFDGGLIIFNGGAGQDSLFNGPQDGASNTYAREPRVRGVEESILD